MWVATKERKSFAEFSFFLAAISNQIDSQFCDCGATQYSKPGKLRSAGCSIENYVIRGKWGGGGAEGEVAAGEFILKVSPIIKLSN